MFSRKMLQMTGLLIAMFLLTVTFTSSVIAETHPEGAYSYNCSDEYYACEGVNLVNGNNSALSNYMYVPAGKLIIISCHNSGTKFQAGCRLVGAGGKTVQTLTAPAGAGTNWGFYESLGGYFYISIDTGDYTAPYEGTGYAQFEYEK